MSTPEQPVTARQVADAMKPLGDVAQNLEALARRLRLATEQGNTALVIELGSQLLTDHVGFAQKFRAWQASRPDRPAWRSPVADRVPRARPGSDDSDRMSS